MTEADAAPESGSYIPLGYFSSIRIDPRQVDDEPWALGGDIHLVLSRA